MERSRKTNCGIGIILSLCANGCTVGKPKIELAVPLTTENVQREIAAFYVWLRQTRQLLTHQHYKGWPKPIPLDENGKRLPSKPPQPVTPERLDEVLKEMPAGSPSPGSDEVSTRS